MFSLIDSEVTARLFDHLFDTLLNESDRGAMIIGATKVEDQLSAFIQRILPNQSKGYSKKLFEYPGLMSSFSAKIEIAYSFRFISEKLYNSLNELRKLRNDAAHNPDSFSIIESQERFDKIFDLGQSMQVHIRNQAIKLMISLKTENLIHYFQQINLSKDEQAEQISGLLGNSKLMDSIEGQLPRWQLIYGLSLICAIIKHEEDGIATLLANNKTWSALSNQNSKG